VNASLRHSLGPAELTLWVRNVLDENYAVHGLYFGNDPRNGYMPERYLQPGEPRQAGLTVRYAF
jgi:outer membrane receptor protein involved in Fe transport